MEYLKNYNRHETVAIGYQIIEYKEDQEDPIVLQTRYKDPETGKWVEGENDVD